MGAKREQAELGGERQSLISFLGGWGTRAKSLQLCFVCKECS